MPGSNPPPFSFAAAKRKWGWSRQKKKRLVAGRSGAERPPTRRDAGCNCSAQSTHPLRNHGQSAYQTSAFFYAVLHSSFIGQNPN